MVRSIVAVVPGFAVMVALVMVTTFAAVATMHPSMRAAPTPAYLAVNLACGVLAAAAGGLVTALIAKQAPLKHASVLAGVVLLLGLASAFLPQDPGMGQQPTWYPWVMPVLAAAGVMAGGALRAVRWGPA